MTPYTSRPRRLPVSIPIDRSTLEMFTDSEIMNLSKGGVFIRADIPPALGSQIDFEFTLPRTFRKVKASGTVIWARKRTKKQPASFPDHPSGMGVQFTSISVEDMDAILDEIEQIIENP